MHLGHQRPAGGLVEPDVGLGPVWALGRSFDTSLLVAGVDRWARGEIAGDLRQAIFLYREVLARTAPPVLALMVAGAR